jgi:hypothetical protein
MERGFLDLREDDLRGQGSCVSAFQTRTQEIFFRYYLFEDPNRLLEFDLTTSDLMISDLMGPSLDGDPLGFGRRCRSNALARGLRPENIIYFSAYHAEEEHRFGSKVLSKSESGKLVELLLARLHPGELLSR